MTIASQTSRISYNGNGSTTAFAVPFKFLSNSDLVVYLRDAVGVQTLQILGTNYSVTGAGIDAGGTVTFVGAPITGVTIVIYRDPPVTQTTSYNNNDPFPAKSHENALDKLTTLIQRVANRLGHALLFSETSSYTNLTLPDPVSGQYLKWRTDLAGLENSAAVTFPPNNYAVATPSEAQAGTLNTVLLTPLSAAQALPMREFDTMAAAVAAVIPATVTFVILNGYTVKGDGPPATYVSRSSQPTHNGKFLNNGQWFELERYDGVYLEDFGAVNSRVGDSIDLSVNADTALSNCIDYCTKKHRAKIIANSGIWRLTVVPPTMTVGISIRGAGHSSSFYHGGTCFLLDYTGGAAGAGDFKWDGSGDAFNSTGGGMQGCSIVRQNAKHGGCLIKLTGVSDTLRPGYMTFRDLFLGATGTGSCDYCIIHDGQNLVTSGSQGLRDILWDNIWAFGADVEAVQLINATHAKLSNWQVSQGGGAVVPIVRITGDTSATLHKTTDLQASNLGISGNLILDNVDNSVIHGQSSTLTITQNCTNTSIFMRPNTLTLSGISRGNLNILNNTFIHDGGKITETTATSGYALNEDGTVEQWMQVTVSGAAVLYNFPIAFATKCLTCEVTPYGLAAADQVTIGLGGTSTGGVVLIGTGTINALVRAKGY